MKVIIEEVNEFDYLGSLIIATYGSETWSMNKETEQKINAFEII